MIALALAAALAGSPTVADFAFMAGRWEPIESERAVSEEGSASQANTSGKMVIIERIKITDEPAGVNVRAFLGYQPGMSLVLRSWDARGYVFENPAAEMPRRVTYWPCGLHLCARAEGTLDGRTLSQDWTYRRAP